jgi:hypothetical protein
MNVTRSKKHWGTPLIVGSLAVLVAASGDGAQEEKAKPVEVVNTPTVNAQQAGTWSVGVDGNVQVGNTSGNPVNVRDVDRAHRTPFQMNCQGTTECTLHVPGSGLLVIEYVTMEIVIQDPSVPIQTYVVTTQNGTTIPHVVLPTRVGATPANFGIYSVSQVVRLYADAFAQLSVRGTVNNSSGISPTSFYMTISGYQVDCGAGSGCPLP